MSDSVRRELLRANRSNLQRHIVISFNMMKQESKGSKKVNPWNGGSTWVSAVACSQEMWDEAEEFMQEIRCLGLVLWVPLLSTFSLSHWANGCCGLSYCFGAVAPCQCPWGNGFLTLIVFHTAGRGKLGKRETGKFPVPQNFFLEGSGSVPKCVCNLQFRFSFGA